MDRFDFSELISFHEVFATNRLSQISAHIVSPGIAQNDNQRHTNVEADCTPSGKTGTVLCPRRHPAALHITRHSSFRCDLCGKAVERGRPNAWMS